MPYITKIETNIKRPGGAVHVGLEPHMLLIGDNGSGKTAILNAIELALTGQAHDLGGRDAAKATVLLQSLIPEGADELYSIITFDTGASVEWRMQRGKKPTVNWDFQMLNTHFLMDEVSDALTGSLLTTVRFLMKYFGDEPEFLEKEEAARRAVRREQATVRAVTTAIEHLSLTNHSGERTREAIVAQAVIDLYENANITVTGSRNTYDKAKAYIDKHGAPIANRESLLFETKKEAEGRLAAAKKQAKENLDYMVTWVTEEQKDIESSFNLLRSSALPGEIGFEIDTTRILFGLRTEGSFTPWISGAEYVAVLAIVAATAALRLPTEDVVLIITPDRALSHRHLHALVDALRPVNRANIFIQTPTVVPVSSFPAWTKLYLEHRAVGKRWMKQQSG